MTRAPRMERVQLNGADIEYDVRGSGEPVVFIHGAILSDGFVPVIEQTGIAENFQIVHYRRRQSVRLTIMEKDEPSLRKCAAIQRASSLRRLGWDGSGESSKPELLAVGRLQGLKL